LTLKPVLCKENRARAAKEVTEREIEKEIKATSTMGNHETGAKFRYEQTGYLVKGHVVLRIGEAEHDTTPGDSWCIPMNVTHGARILEDSIAIEVFSPARADYLPKGKMGK